MWEIIPQTLKKKTNALELARAAKSLFKTLREIKKKNILMTVTTGKNGILIWSLSILFYGKLGTAIWQRKIERLILRHET